MQVADQRGQYASVFPLLEDSGVCMRNLTISDTNKDLLLNVEGLTSILVDALFLDPEHPRRSGFTVRGKFDFDAIAPLVQRVGCTLYFLQL